MRAVLQRVLEANVKVDGKIVGKIGKGFVVFLGVGSNDDESDLNYLVKKICGLRIFEDENQKMNLSPLQVGAELLVISNFTLYANTAHGFRPSFVESMPPNEAKFFVDKFVENCKKMQTFKNIQTGIFGADMNVCVSGDGPINIIFDTKEQNK